MPDITSGACGGELSDGDSVASNFSPNEWIGSGVGTWKWMLESETVHVSSEWKRIRGYRDKELSTSPDLLINHVHQEDRGSVESLRSAVRLGRTERFSCDYRVRWSFDTSCMQMEATICCKQVLEFVSYSNLSRRMRSGACRVFGTASMKPTETGFRPNSRSRLNIFLPLSAK
ncbi:MAG: PAS domain-containing protein [Planctomycetota bacterium]